MNATKPIDVPGAPAPARVGARERLLAAAEALFYEEGVNNVGIDKVIERAGVAKASLYSHFKSKDELVRAYIEERQVARRARIERAVSRHREPRLRLLAVFDALAEVIGEPSYRGCAFTRTSSELRGDSGARSACIDARAWTRSMFADLAREAGVTRPEPFARQMLMLYDGASVAAQLDGQTGAAAQARAIAEMLLDAACAAPAAATEH